MESHLEEPCIDLDKPGTKVAQVNPKDNKNNRELTFFIKSNGIYVAIKNAIKDNNRPISCFFTK